MQKSDLISASEFCLHYRVEMSFIGSLEEYGLLETIKENEEIFISAEQVCELEKIIRLHYDLNVNMEGIDVILHLLKNLEAAQEEAVRLKNQLSFYSAE